MRTKHRSTETRQEWAVYHKESGMIVSLRPTKAKARDRWAFKTCKSPKYGVCRATVTETVTVLLVPNEDEEGGE